MDTGEYDGDYAQSCQAWNIQQSQKMIYIQSNSERTLPHHFDAACAMYGAIESCNDYRLTSFEEVQSGKFDQLIKTSLFVGSVEFMTEVFNRNSKAPKLPMNSDRESFTMTLDAVRQDIENGETWFVKPFQQKLFSGIVVDKYSISSLREFAGDLEVRVYPVLPRLLSEWRVYIYNNKVEDIRNYSGNVMLFPDVDFVMSMQRKFIDKLPRTYVMDVGICVNNDPYSTTPNSDKLKNVIVEFNDMYAIGNYGVPNDIYVSMLRERYFEIMRT